MMLFRLFLVIFFYSGNYLLCNGQRTSLDDVGIELYRFIRRQLNQIQRTALQEPFSNNVRIQEPIPKSVPFPCFTTNGRSPNRPNSVHTLRPGDIDVIGAIGDSMLAGFGVTAKTAITMLSNSRGMSFPIGGDLTWREVTTLPNILKEFNPNLIGYSIGVALENEKEAQFNVAADGALSSHVPYMTKVLIKRIMADPRVNITRDWKMITLLIAANDFCGEICYYQPIDSFIASHRNDLLTSLRLIKKYLPRTFVNLIIAPDVSQLAKFTNLTTSCFLNQRVFCPCFIGEAFRLKRAKVKEVLAKSRETEYNITLESEFESDDFAVVAQPFLWNTDLPKNSRGETEWTYFGLDCFHFSQKAHSLAAKGLWQNLLERVGQKTSKFDIDEVRRAPLVCPTEENPYLFTNRNSRSLSKKN